MNRGSSPNASEKKLSPELVADVQRLALSLPGDARVLWQLGELANAYGEVRTAARMFDGCVTEFGLSSPRFRERGKSFEPRRKSSDPPRVATLPRPATSA